MFEKQYLVILSLMCLAFSQLQALNTKSDKLAELLEQGRHHLESACSLTSWNEPCLKKLLAIAGMRRFRCDQCQFGTTSFDDAGNVGPARKATGFMDE